ncbi:alpha/beta-hydrolase [Mycena rebaudengoi]|nr:alpha/beta-hydrolase [Mycena rebaudengoi]
MSFCDNCFVGKHEKIGGIDTYIATPVIPYPKDKVVIFLTDVFGLALQNNLLLADDFARNGFKTVVIDLFNGAPRSVEVPEEGVTRFAATGFCFGARYAFDLAFDNVIHVCAVSHPSRLIVPDDLQKYAAVSQAPLLINSCEDDQAFPLEAQAEADRIFGDGKFTPGYKREYFPGCEHGFAVRGDMTDPYVKAGKEGAFKASVEWFAKYL